MEQFRISDIRALFALDLQMFRDETRGHLGLLIARSPHARESLSEVIRFAHTLKGLAATVGAWGLSNWGADLERLFELAGTFLDSNQNKAEEIFRFVMLHMEAWSVMNAFTLAEQFDPAWDHYRALRATMEQRWPGYLGPVSTSLPCAAAPTGAGLPSESIPSLGQKSSPPEPAEAPREERATPRATVVNLAPPPLLRRSTETEVAAPAAPAIAAGASRTHPPAAPARPMPPALNAPELRRAPDKSRRGAPATAAAAISPAAKPSSSSNAPPILHVAPPNIGAQNSGISRARPA